MEKDKQYEIGVIVGRNERAESIYRSNIRSVYENSNFMYLRNSKYKE